MKIYKRGASFAALSGIRRYRVVALAFALCALFSHTLSERATLAFAGKTISTASYTLCTEQTSEPRTIADFFLLIPERYLTVPRAERPALLRRMKAGAVGSGFEVDVANGFMNFQGHAEESYTLALFRRPDGSPLIAITYYGIRIDDRRPNSDPEDIAELYFLRYERGRWRDVTRETLPVPFNKNFRYNLPRKGTTIEVISEGDHKEYDLVWARGRFTVRRPPRANRDVH